MSLIFVVHDSTAIALPEDRGYMIYPIYNNANRRFRNVSYQALIEMELNQNDKIRKFGLFKECHECLCISLSHSVGREIYWSCGCNVGNGQQDRNHRDICYYSKA